MSYQQRQAAGMAWREIGVRAAYICVWAMVLVSALEVASWIAFRHSDAIRDVIGRPSLDRYEMADPEKPSRWRLRSGYSETLAEAIRAKEDTGRILGAKRLRKRGQRLGIVPDEVIYQINSSGFIGPEIGRSKSRRRVLCIGDSCTFGSLFQYFSYPRTMEREFEFLGHSSEVINAGVEGYSPRHVLHRIEELKALRPDWTTIYIGWNPLYEEGGLSRLVGGAKYSWAAIRLFARIWKRASWWERGNQEAALELYRDEKRPDRDAAYLALIESYQFAFLSDLEKLVDEMESVGSRVALLTLPCLYVMDEQPSPRALRAGHLPYFTDNPFVLAKVAEVYNKRIKELAKRRNLLLIDLATWSLTALTPREDFFFDSVHLVEEGQVMVGRKVAGDLVRDPSFVGPRRRNKEMLPASTASPN